MSGSLFTLAMARQVLKMLDGNLIPYSKFDGLIANTLMGEGIITIVSRGSMRSFRMPHLSCSELYFRHGAGRLD